MPLKDNVLYPRNYVEPEPDPPVNEGRNMGIARSLIARAVPNGGEPMTVEQITDLICGRIPTPEDLDMLRRGTHPDIIDADSNEAGSIARAKEKPKKGRVIRGMAQCKSLTREEVAAMVLEEIESRRGTWTPLPEELSMVEFEPKVK